MTGATADVSGYMAELERNLFVGRPINDVIKYHEIALKLQETALNTLRPGIKASEVDKAVIRRPGSWAFMITYFTTVGMVSVWRRMGSVSGCW